jgi:flagellar FliJ protein
MAQFKFQLEGVLRQRKHVEQQRQRDLAERLAELAPLEMQLRELDEQAKQSTGDVRDNRLTGKLDLAFLAGHRRFMLALQRRGVEIARKIAARQKVVDEARALLMEAAKGRKAVEKLREKQFDRWRAERAAKEQSELDEVGMQIGYRNLMDDDAGRQSHPGSFNPGFSE